MKNTSIKILAIMVMAISLSFALISCGGAPTTLEGYIDSNEAVAQEIEAFSVDGMEIDITENTLTYTYKYDQTFDETTSKLMKQELEKAMKTTASTFESVKEDLVEETGISDIVVKMIYMDNDENILYENEY